MKSISTKQMSYQDWIDSRRKGIGGSDVAPILNVSPYKTPVDIYLDKTQKSNSKPFISRAMAAGTHLEPVIVKLFEYKTGLKTRKDNKIRIHPKHDFLIGNLL